MKFNRVEMLSAECGARGKAAPMSSLHMAWGAPCPPVLHSSPLHKASCHPKAHWHGFGGAGGASLAPRGVKAIGKASQHKQSSGCDCAAPGSFCRAVYVTASIRSFHLPKTCIKSVLKQHQEPQGSQADRRNRESTAALPLPMGECGSALCCGKGAASEPGANPSHRQPITACRLSLWHRSCDSQDTPERPSLLHP